MVRKLSRFAQIAVAAITVGLGAAMAPSVHAEEFAGDVPDLVWLDMGWSGNTIGTNASFQGPNGVGGTIDFEEALGIPGTKSTVRMFGTARISKQRRHIDFGYVSLRRKGSRQLTEDITWSDYTIEAMSFATAKFNTAFVYGAFRYDFLHVEPVRISGSAGVTWLSLSTELDASGSVTDPNGGIQTTYYKRGSAGAPVPMIGLNFDWALTKRLVVRAYARLFRLNVSDFDGGLHESGMRLNWYFARHFGMGLSFDRTDLDLNELKVDHDNIVKADYNFAGISLFINLAF